MWSLSILNMKAHHVDTNIWYLLHIISSTQTSHITQGTHEEYVFSSNKCGKDAEGIKG